MLESMTGFGQSAGTAGSYRIRIDMKSVNHRYGEVVIRIPREWSMLEEGIRKRVLNELRRGRIEVVVAIEREAMTGSRLEINWELAEQYVQAANLLAEHFHLESRLNVQDLFSLPDVIMHLDSEPEHEEQFNIQFMKLLDDALSQLVKMRRAEGQHLYHDISTRLRDLELYHGSMEKQAQSTAEETQQRLRQKIEELLNDKAAFDEQRFQMEVALLAERADISEELTRIRSHFQQFRQFLEAEEPIGRKLDFLVQELNREVNTIGSKSAHSLITASVIEMKAELERIREQIQNIQ